MTTSGARDESSDPNEVRLRTLAKEQYGIDLLSLAQTRTETMQRLTSGWTMLERLCPVSEFPLFQKGDVIWSVRLGIEIRDEKSEDRKSSSPSELQEQQKQEDLLMDAARREYEGEDSLESFEEIRPDEAVSPRELAEQEEEEDLVSERIGEKLLLGWTMMKEHCPVTKACPLMRDPATNRLWSAKLNDFVPDQQAPAVPKPQVTNEDNSEFLAQTKLRNDMSRLIGDKLLLGWTMLDESCPSCPSCPLMLDLEGRKWSAYLNAYLPTPNSAAATTKEDSSTETEDELAYEPRGKGTSSFSEAPSRKQAAGGDKPSDAVMRKVRELTARLEATEDLAKMQTIVGLIKDSIVIMAQLRQLNE